MLVLLLVLRLLLMIVQSVLVLSLQTQILLASPWQVVGRRAFCKQYHEIKERATGERFEVEMGLPLGWRRSFQSASFKIYSN